LLIIEGHDATCDRTASIHHREVINEEDRSMIAFNDMNNRWWNFF